MTPLVKTNANRVCAATTTGDRPGLSCPEDKPEQVVDEVAHVVATGERVMGKIVCFGELLLRLGAPGRQVLLQSPVLDVHVGGAEANVAVSLARFGHDAAMVGLVADNALGEAAL